MTSGCCPKTQNKVRRLTELFDDKFYREVYRNIVAEKVIRRFEQGKAPDSRILKIGLNNLAFHMFLPFFGKALEVCLASSHFLVKGIKFSVRHIFHAFSLRGCTAFLDRIFGWSPCATLN